MPIGASHGMYLKDVQTRAMVAQAEAGGTSAARVRDIQAALGSGGAAEMIRREAVTVGMMASAVVAGFLLFLLLL